MSKFISSSNNTRIDNIDLSSDYNSSYVAYEDGKLARVILLNLYEWNPPSSVGIVTAQDTRPQTTFDLQGPVGCNYAKVELMTVPGAA